MNTVTCTMLARLPPARFMIWSICENTCFTCASKLLAMSRLSLSRVAVCPATQTILPPSVMTPGENARESWNGVFSMYSAAVTGSETRASKNPARMRFMIFSLERMVSTRTLAQAALKDKRGSVTSADRWAAANRLSGRHRFVHLRLDASSIAIDSSASDFPQWPVPRYSPEQVGGYRTTNALLERYRLRLHKGLQDYARGRSSGVQKNYSTLSRDRRHRLSSKPPSLKACGDGCFGRAINWPTSAAAKKLRAMSA